MADPLTLPLSLGLEAATGGLFGIVGTALGRVASYFERKQTFLQEQQRWAHEYKLHELNMQARAQETEMELALAAQAGSWAGLEASIKACLLYTSPSPRDGLLSRMPSSA